jgi:hypothetical protein
MDCNKLAGHMDCFFEPLSELVRSDPPSIVTEALNLIHMTVPSQEISSVREIALSSMGWDQRYGVCCFLLIPSDEERGTVVDEWRTRAGGTFLFFLFLFLFFFLHP